MNSPRSVAFAAIAVVLLASCSSDSGESTTEPVASSSTTSEASTTATPIATDVPADTSTSSTTLSTSPITTEVPATTSPSLFEPGTAKFEVEAAVEFFEQQWKSCLNALPNCDLDLVVERLVGDEITTIEREAIRLNQNDYRVSNAEEIEYRVDDVQIRDTSADAVVCVTDPGVLTAADGTIVDDTHFSFVLDWTLVLVDGVWNSQSRLIRGEATEGVDDDVCAASS